MKTIRHWRFVKIATLVAILWRFAGSDQVQAFESSIGGIGSPRVQFIGTFYSLEQKPKVWRMNTIKVKVKSKEWLFSIKRVVDLTGDLDQFEILENIWPAILIFRGPDNVIDPLIQSDIAGKRFAVEGTLYFSDRILQVNSVTEVTKKKEKKE